MEALEAFLHVWSYGVVLAAGVKIPGWILVMRGELVIHSKQMLVPGIILDLIAWPLFLAMMFTIDKETVLNNPIVGLPIQPLMPAAKEPPEPEWPELGDETCNKCERRVWVLPQTIGITDRPPEQ